MDGLWQDLLAQQHASGFVDLAGARAELRIPLREEVVNDLLARVVGARWPQVSSCTLTIREQNAVAVRLRFAALALAPSVTLHLAVDPRLHFLPQPTVRIALARRGLSGWLAAARPLVRGALPPAVVWASDGFEVDVGALLTGQGLAWLVPFIVSGEFTTELGLIWVSLSLAGPPAPGS